MTGLELLPVVVLGCGLLVGLGAAWRLLRREDGEARADLLLRLADLEAERDDAYAKLRGVEGVALSDADRDTLEVNAARVLRDIDDTRAELAKITKPRPAKPAPAAARGRFFARHPALGGALFGGGLVALVAVLVFWAQRDAQPRANAATAPPAQPAGGMPSGAERGEPPLPPQVAAEVAGIRDRLAATPDDLALRRRLADVLLAHGQFFDAFQEARQILDRDPNDAMGHYVSGVVRYTMGNADAALEHFASARAADPAYAPAAIVEGIVRLQLGDREGAVATWSAGLEAAGGHEPRLEHLLRLAREGRSAREILDTPPPAG